MLQLVLGKTIKKIGLILCFVRCFAQQIPIADLRNARVVAGDNAIAAKRKGAFQEFVEF